METTIIRADINRAIITDSRSRKNIPGRVIPFLSKQGIKPEQILVIHDELEMPFGKIKLKFGGSARGHKGLRSIIYICGKEFTRLSFGIGRPEQKEMVGQYVLQNFSEDPTKLEQYIEQAADMIESIIKE